MGCDKEMFYDPGTNSCAYCSQLCEYVDIQGTRDECEKKCPGFLDAAVTPISPLPLQGDLSTVSTQGNYSTNGAALIVISVIISVGLLAAVCTLLYKKRKALIKRFKKQDCTDGMSSQPHVQECGTTAVRPVQEGLLTNQGYPDLPDDSFRCSIEENNT